MEDNETEVTDKGNDEAYCRWWECKKCGNETFEGSIFCPMCGRKIIPPAK
jgi:uncharacterized OB-fold protein